jgi:helicase SWR1
VHIYRLISEHTIEANILRKATQKQMLDDVVIQEGEFTTDYFNRLSVHDVIGDHGDDDDELGGSSSAAANAVMDRLLGNETGVGTDAGVGGGGGGGVGASSKRLLEQAEDREDVVAAKAAEKETRADDADFDERPAEKKEPTVQFAVDEHDKGEGDVADGAADDGPVELNADGGRMGTIDDYMLRAMRRFVEGTALAMPRDRKSKKRRRDTRKR